MAFKMGGMSFGKGTNYKSPQTMKKESAMKMAKKNSAMDMAKDPMKMKTKMSDRGSEGAKKLKKELEAKRKAKEARGQAAEEAKSALTMKKGSAMDMKKDPMMMKKDPMMMKKDPMKMKKDPMKMKSPMKKKTQAERAAERLAKKEARLTAKMRNERVKDTDSKKADKLDTRITNVKSKKVRKQAVAANVEEGKKGLRERRANTRKTVNRSVVATDKKFNEKGVKTNVTRVNKVTGTTVAKKKSGTGANKTVQKTVAKPKNLPKKAAQTFGQAFAAARKAGKKQFTYKGKPYHTRTKEEDRVHKAKKTQNKFKQMTPEEKADYTMKDTFKKA